MTPADALLSALRRAATDLTVADAAVATLESRMSTIDAEFAEIRATVEAAAKDNPAFARLLAAIDSKQALLPREGKPAAINLGAPTAGRLLTVEEASARLGVSPVALRHRCRRAQRREGREVIARLGAGVIGFRLGKTGRSPWRFKFEVV